MRFSRRAWLLAAPTSLWAQADDDAVRAGRAWRWPRDHGAHAGARNEWWYATGWLEPPRNAPPIGFQVTFFRHRTGLAASLPGHLAPRQLLFAHAALSDIGAQRHWQLQRLQRELEGGVHAAFKLTLQMQATQPLLLQGQGGHSRKGPLPQQASHYYSLPHLHVRARVERDSRARELQGSAWLDHESVSYTHLTLPTNREV